MFPELAFCYYTDKPFYYSDSEWFGSERMTDWIKSILLFFDGVATAYTQEQFERLLNNDSVLAQPLAELGMLHNYEPSGEDEINARVDLIFQQSPNDQMEEVARFLDKLSRWSKTYFYDPDFATGPVAAALMANRLRTEVTNASIQPLTSNPTVAKISATVLKSFAAASRAEVVSADMMAIGIDLAKVPLDEVLDFRKKYGADYSSYARDIRDFTLSLSLMAPAERTEALQSRIVFFKEKAENLRATSRKSFKRASLGLALGIAGAAWSLKSGNPVGAILGGSGATVSFKPSSGIPTGFSYSYILHAQKEFTR
jgi:hypothetical protein